MLEIIQIKIGEEICIHHPILQRPTINNSALIPIVKEIMEEVKQNGDMALKDLTLRFDKVALNDLKVSEEELNAAENEISQSLKEAIIVSAQNIKKFHEAQAQPILSVSTMEGVVCQRKSVPIEKVGLYIPGGSAPLFSTVLMLGIPAALAGCKEIVLCSPPGKEAILHPAILFAAKTVGISEIYKVGGVQAVAAMSYGTESIPKVYKIFGPGNQYVTAAKTLAFLEGTAIDMPAGPSEVCVLADEKANATFIAADLLAQAEHGPDSHLMLITNSEALAHSVNAALQNQLPFLTRKTIAEKALDFGKILLVEEMTLALDLVNKYAPEHLIVHTQSPTLIAEKVENAGSVFLGSLTPESVGDYSSGTNHTLPTNGFARAYSGVSLESFQKKITYQTISEEGIKNIGKHVIAMAEAEGLDGHAMAVRKRLESIL